MARSRSIKPGFFSNDALVELSFEYRLLFIGLWTIADKEGRLLDRPKKIKMEIFPADDVDCSAGLSQLESKGFLVRYEISGIRYIQILNWKKHQSPHIKEADSTLPEIPERAPEIPERAALTPSSLTPSSLTPDSLPPDSGLRVFAREPRIEVDEKVHGAEFAKVKDAYPKFSGRQDWINAEHHCRIRVDRDGMAWSDLIEAASRYRAYCDSGGVSGPLYVMTPGKFFSAEDKPWLQSWTPPPTKAQARQDKNISASLQWLAEEEAKDAACRPS